ncbi:MAG: Rieske (2Fe-2S) protein [Sphingobacteriaceae bacterium]|nr:MAG: Rieske (2Fe-2S) protein [Sphingobacteriaceae bacterium]
MEESETCTHHKNEGLVAFDDRCSHKGASLAGGMMMCGKVQCPWHGSQFDVKTGAVKAGPGKQGIQCYEVKEEGEKELQKQGLISKVANTFFLDHDNPDSKGNFRPGPISLARDPKLSFFSFLYKALLDGLKPSVGFDEKTENQVNKTVATVSKLVKKINNISIFKKDTPAEKAAKEKEKAQKKKEKEAEKAAEEKEKAAKKAQEVKEKEAKKALETKKEETN